MEKITTPSPPVLIEDLGMLFATEKSKSKTRFGLYRCECGNEFKSVTTDIKRGQVSSCGCYRKKKHIETQTKHGLTKHPLYQTWLGMIYRCNNPENISYKRYGAIGIYVCDRWLDVNNFIYDMYPSYEEGLTIDRINESKVYSKDTCRWATKAQQAQTTRRIRSCNKSGYRGVYFDKRSSKWRACILSSGKRINLGYYTTAKDGAMAYDKYVIDNNLEHTTNGLYD